MFENKEFFIDCNGNKVHSKLDFPTNQAEKMPVLVLIPGLTGHIEEDHIKAVAKAANEVGYVTLRSELYGHGQSDGDFSEHTVLIWMSQAMKVIEYASNLEFADKVVLSGHSQGGLTAVLAAGLMEDKLSALMPLSPAMVIYYGTIQGMFFGMKLEGDLPDKFYFGDKSLTSNYYRSARLLPVDAAIEMFKKPVQIIHGTEDEAVPYSFGVKLNEDYANSTLVTIEGDDHCYTRHLDQVVEAVKAFLTEMK